MSTLTLNLDEHHMTALEALATEQDMSKTGVMRQALRLYQMVHQRAKDGHQLAFVDRNGKLMRQVVVGLPAFDDETPAGVSPPAAPLVSEPAVQVSGQKLGVWK